MTSEYVLDPDFMVIADESGAIGLAGIMGGRATAICDATTEVLLECAHFMPDAIAGRARRLGLFTDAAQRFERGVDPCLPAVALERATALLLEIAGGEAGPLQVTRARDAAEPRLWVRLRRGRLQRLLGATVPDEEVRSLMRAISRACRARSRRVARGMPAASLRHPNRGGSDRRGRAAARVRQHRRESCDCPAGGGIRQ